MKYTNNYNLKKPGITDIVDIEDFNYNADVVDAKIKEVENKAASMPTKTSQLVNDSGFLTSSPVTSVNGKTGTVTLSANDVGASPNVHTHAYSALEGKPNIPSKTSQLTNDSGFITSIPVSSVNNKTGSITLSAKDISCDNGQSIEVQLADKASLNHNHDAKYAPAGYGLGGVCQDIGGKDLNTIENTGFYRGYNMQNTPGTDQWYYVEVYCHFGGSGGWIYQRAIELTASTRSVFERHKLNGQWQPWRKILNQDDYDKLFQYANNGKTSIANVIGGLSASNTHTEIANRITAINNVLNDSLQSNDRSTLTRTIDWLNQRKNDIAWHLNQKNVGANGGEGMATLISKIGNINTGKRYASGTVKSSSFGCVFNSQNNDVGGTFFEVTVDNLTFKPRIIIVRKLYSEYVVVTTYHADLFTKNGQIDMDGRAITTSGGSAHVDDRCFVLPVQEGNKDYAWEAFD